MKTQLFNNVADVQADLLVVFVPSEGELPAATAQADEKVNGQIAALREQTVFKGSVAQTLLLPSVVEGQPALLLVGTGKEALSDMNVKKVAAAVGTQIKSLPYANVAVAASGLSVKDRDADNMTTLLAQWLNEAFYEFLGFKQSDAEKVSKVKTLQIEGTSEDALKVGVATAAGSAINAPPMTFESEGKQYVAIEVGLGGAWPQWFVSATPELKSQVPSNVLYVFELP